ncbi:acetate/propionate family kinase [Beijerinckia indica]|uniref:Acetate kinase n=1 Tax=Beijerinckia indica subsp. indica (strain ATCC 9039 / DSM 1715 / NCIMB 8712) TaxID=395963 RepID=B2ICG6_BEII9|nr:acetate/propionate family kinase [Beijerinckia indica]ACB93855.1 acetate kinase [Beijerinckia indica subsp. indica ATCC 9039]
MTQALLVVNAGSSSIKFKLYSVNGDDLDLVMGGALDGIGSQPRLKVKDHAGTILVEHDYAVAEISTTEQAQTAIADWLTPHIKDYVIIGIGHRVVHGGSVYSRPVLVDDQVMATLETFIPLAPLHQLGNLDPIRVLRQRRPDLPQVACFDTAFHFGHPELSDRFALPRSLYDEGVRRYGFHGLSYEYVHAALRDIAPDTAHGRVIIAHLGSGASVCCLHEGKSIETTMGFTALDGLPMGTRSGTLDPGVVLHLIEQKGMKPAEVGTMLYKQSGLLGLSGISNDVRALLASDRPEAKMAIDFFCLRVAQAMASLSVTIYGLDGLVFTAGIGENAPEVRARVIEHLRWSGLALDPAANEAPAPSHQRQGNKGRRIDGKESRVPIFVIPTDEERMIGLHTLRLLRQLKHHS